ncbi:TIGR04283 family arsenosugar biosynthesis glycosyltransferase [soil metagenome]
MLSIIIPTYNEADQITNTLNKIYSANNGHIIEIIIADGGSTDSTADLSIQNNAVVLNCKKKGRASQMNEGALSAKYDLLYFLHADSVPPDNFTEKIIIEYNNNFKSGCFRLKFDIDHWFLSTNTWFTRFDVNILRFGDQSLFVEKKVFHASGGFREDLIMMEDQEIIHRLKSYGNFKVIKDFVTTSSRKYRDNGIYRMQFIFYRLWAMYYLGFSQERMIRVHKSLIKKNKI